MDRDFERRREALAQAITHHQGRLSVLGESATDDEVAATAERFHEFLRPPEPSMEAIVETGAMTVDEARKRR